MLYLFALSTPNMKVSYTINNLTTNNPGDTNMHKDTPFPYLNIGYNKSHQGFSTFTLYLIIIFIGGVIKNKMIPPKGIATAIKLTLRGSLILLTGQNFGEYFFGKIFSAKKKFKQNFY